MTAIKPQFMQQRQGKDFVAYAGLLDAAHEAGLLSIRTELVQRPSPDNEMTAICYATVTMLDSQRGEPLRREFSGIGDANPANVGRMIIPHIIRMAETRAKARALRDAINVGVAAVEELGGDDDDRPSTPQRVSHQTPAQPPTPARPAPGGRTPPPPPGAPAEATLEEWEEQERAGHRIDWTQLWSWAKARGIHSRDDLAAASGIANPNVSTPLELRRAVEDRTAAPAGVAG